MWSWMTGVRETSVLNVYIVVFKEMVLNLSRHQRMWPKETDTTNIVIILIVVVKWKWSQSMFSV